ncbi:MAG: hypothetical protein C0622_05285 [Desulfuromonas sp.]|nr:MAG: hypothetical protein C0622_05285 [Desulfuromonas sp.]
MKKLLFLALVVLTACVPRGPEQWGSLPGDADLLNLVAQRSGEIKTLDTAASVHLTSHGKYYSSQQFLLLERPDRLRADVLTGFGQLVLQLTSDGDQLAVFLNTEVPGRFLSGPATYENFLRFIRVPLAPRELLAILLYDPPMRAFDKSRVALSERGDRLLLILTGGDSRQELSFDSQRRLTGCRYYWQETLQLSVEYDDIAEEDGFPRQLIVEIPEEETRLKLSLSEVVLNEPIDPQRFRLSQPEGSLFEALP